MYCTDTQQVNSAEGDLCVVLFLYSAFSEEMSELEVESCDQVMKSINTWQNWLEKFDVRKLILCVCCFLCFTFSSLS